MKHRAVGAVLFGGGVLLLALAAGLVFVVKPAMTKLPYDLEPSTSIAEAKGATFLQISESGIGIHQADLDSIVKVTPERDKTAALSGDLAGETVVWQVGQTVERTDRKERVSAYAAELALDRVTGEAVEWNEQFLDENGAPEKISFAGQVYKFPFNSERGNYEVFDRDLRQTRVAEFKGTEDVNGLEAYRYEQVITDEKLSLAADRMGLLLGVLAPGSTSGDLVYSNTRTLWVDPVTGAYVKVREQQKKVLVPNAGAPVTLLDADFSYNEETVTSSVQRAKDSRFQLTILGVAAPVGLAVLGLVLILVALFVSRSRTPATVGRHSADPTPTRVDEPAVRDDEREGGPLTDEIPPASTNWKSEVPGQRPAQDDAEKH
ncbi:DUF3068 domain-containing protein [Micromonospora sp. WMMD1082]|uniref:DUF3068 domain-containing protein n=1 Tax=Micromonospora sp. WMMD1082 TaxID=3016104 RepID=UPI002417884E|nr:DUF3068 domain-containing protein [Micromonospora sp. WMMD1082]MDG4794474.1 DUF3068 domain-containing protein [Micromonospora sp. WMMD1082]